MFESQKKKTISDLLHMNKNLKKETKINIYLSLKFKKM